MTTEYTTGQSLSDGLRALIQREFGRVNRHAERYIAGLVAAYGDGVYGVIAAGRVRADGADVRREIFVIICGDPDITSATTAALFTLADDAPVEIRTRIEGVTRSVRNEGGT